MEEKKELTGKFYDMQGFSVHDGPGIRLTLFMKGCPLHCLWCHSPESQQHRFQLGWLDLKCIGTELCQSACVNACPEGSAGFVRHGGHIPAPIHSLSN